MAKTSLDWLELENNSSNPADTDSNKRGIAMVGTSLMKWTGSAWSSITGSGGITTFDEAYDNSATLTVDAGSFTVAGTHSSNDVLTVSNQAGDSGDCVQISNSGTGKDINGTSSTWSVTKAGVIDSTDITTDSITVGSGSGHATIDSSGDYNLILQTGNSTTCDITLVDGANGDVDITLNGTGAVNINGTTAGNDSLVVAAGDVSLTDGSVTITDGDNAASLTVTNATVTTGNMVTLTADAATTGSILYIDNGGDSLTSGYFINCNDDGSSLFNVGADGATEIATTATDTKALVVTGAQTSENMVALTSSGVTASAKATLLLNPSGNIADDGTVLRIAPSGTPVAGSKMISLVGTGENIQAIEADVDVTDEHAIGLTGTGNLTGASMLYVDNDGTPAANTDSIVNFTFTGTDTNNPIVCKVDNSTNDAQPLRVVGNVASATRAVATFVQDSTTGAKEVIELDQDDTDQALMKFTATEGSGNTINTDDKSGGTAVYAMVDVNGSTYYISCTPGA